MNQYPQKKVMTFNKHTDDFEFYVNYGDMSFMSESELELVSKPASCHQSVSVDSQ